MRAGWACRRCRDHGRAGCCAARSIAGWRRLDQRGRHGRGKSRSPSTSWVSTWRSPAGAIDDRVEPALEQVLHIEERVLQCNGRFAVAVGADLGEAIGVRVWPTRKPLVANSALMRIHGVVVALIVLDVSCTQQGRQEFQW